MPGELAVRGPDGIVGPRSPDRAEQFQRLLESFFNEARLLAPFNHPALVRVHRFWKANGTAYMAMQYCPGMTLMQARGAMRGPPDEAWLRAVVEPILDALERLHRAGVFHRDISPDNILLLPNGRPILLDFGSARRVVGAGTKSLTAVLKPNFAPVEQYGDSAGMAQGPWTDLYALGATVHFMLTGEVPTPAVMRVVNDERTPLAAAGGSAFPGVGAKFLAAVDWTAAVAPKDRPQSVAALRQALGYDEPPAPPPAVARAREAARAARARRAGAGGLRRAGRRRLGARRDDVDVRCAAPPQASMPTPVMPVAPAPIAAAAPVPETVHATQRARARRCGDDAGLAAAAKPDAATSPAQRPATAEATARRGEVDGRRRRRRRRYRSDCGRVAQPCRSLRRPQLHLPRVLRQPAMPGAGLALAPRVHRSAKDGGAAAATDRSLSAAAVDTSAVDAAAAVRSWCLGTLRRPPCKPCALSPS